MNEKATRRRGTELEDAILDAAWDVLETDGWNGFTFAGVAERAHSSKPVLYRRWRTREELLRATLRRRGEITPADVPDTGSLRGDVIAKLTEINQLRSSMAAVRMAPSGLAIPLPAMSGAEPCTGSYKLTVPPTVAEGSMPSEPVMTPDSSDRMSPKRFSVSTTSKLRGVFIRCIAQASTY